MPTNSAPLVSVVIPAYNHEAYVQQTIRSIIAQTYANIELLVLNDGSKDATFEKINEMKEECQDRFATIWFHSHANMGTCATLNALLEQAKGKYVYLIASDDLAKPQAIQCLVDILEADDQCVLAVGDNEYIDADGVRVYKARNRENVTDEAEAEYTTLAALFCDNKFEKYLSNSFGSYESLLQGNYIPNGYVMRRDIIEWAGRYKAEAPLEDYYMALQMAKQGTLRFCGEVLFSYRLHNSNTSANVAHMEKITATTLLYELRQVALSDNEAAKLQAQAYMTKRHYLFALQPVIAAYRVRNRLISDLYLEVFGKSFSLHKKRRYQE